MERAVKWERLAVLRSPVMVLLALAAICVGVFMLSVPAGWIAVGVALLFLAYVTDVTPEGGEQRGR